jgi:malonate-semialdehyde dehydrogenase (acetylating) / methylmalonate-semialdehyde dehydrogenase
MSFERLKNFINGKWVEAKTEEFVEIRNPARDTILSHAPMSTRADVDAAVKAAQDAFHDWRNTPPVARARYLHRLVTLMEERFNALSVVQTTEHGKTIDESRGETRRGIEMVEVATGIPSLLQGYLLEDVAEGVDEYAIYQPLGVFCCIAPFNFPFMVPLWFLPYAIACGNTFVVKPSPRAPMSQVELFKLFDEIDLPPGVVNLVHGAREAAERLLEHPQIQGVTFVGTTEVGRHIYKRCGETGKRVIAQCGAKNFIVIMPDAEIDKAMVSLMASFFGNTGQRCLSGANLLVIGDNGVYRRFVDRFVQAAASLKVGDGLDPTVQMGPLQNVAAKQRVLEIIDRGVAEGARLTLDGRKLRLAGDVPETCFLNPTVFEDVTPGMAIAREEIFGPVASVLRVKDLDEAIGVINGSPYGNASSIFTNNGKWARQFQHDVDPGNVGINIGIAAPMAFFPFGGRKDSFFGVLHGQGKEAFRFFTDPKIVIERWF